MDSPLLKLQVGVTIAAEENFSNAPLTCNHLVLYVVGRCLEYKSNPLKRGKICGGHHMASNPSTHGVSPHQDFCLYKLPPGVKMCLRKIFKTHLTYQSCLVDVSDVIGVGKSSVVKGQDAAACLQQLLVQTHPEIKQNLFVSSVTLIQLGIVTASGCQLPKTNITPQNCVSLYRSYRMLM